MKLTCMAALDMLTNALPFLNAEMNNQLTGTLSPPIMELPYY